LLLLGLEYCSGSFLFLVSFSFLAGSIRTAIWYCVVGEAGCNWYLLILINSLYRKKNKQSSCPVFVKKEDFFTGSDSHEPQLKSRCILMKKCHVNCTKSDINVS
jgi:hypothetical protein